MARWVAIWAGFSATSRAAADEVKPKELFNGSRRLRIRNGCDRETLWVAHEAGSSIGPDEQNVRIDPGEFHDFITSNGLSATRYWGKMRCDPAGNHCRLGGSGGPGQACVRGSGAQADYSHCAPPVDTKFEATFGIHGLKCSPEERQMMGCDYVDMSLVDGYTLPFKLDIHNGKCVGKEYNIRQIDCSDLTFDSCPEAENLTAAHATVSLKARHPQTQEVAGCYSPCMKMADTKWDNAFARGRHRQDPAVAPYCCPTPPESPEACRAGPLQKTSYVQHVRKLCPDVYTFAYDDAAGLMRCSSDTQYELTFFCPPPTTVEAAKDGLRVVQKFHAQDGNLASRLGHARPSALAVVTTGLVLFSVLVLTTFGVHRARRPCYSHVPGVECSTRAPTVDSRGPGALSHEMPEGLSASSPWLLTAC